MSTKQPITVSTAVNAPVSKVWQYWTAPEHITQWTNASDDWHAPRAENDIRTGGKFLTRMEAKDGSFGFDFEGQYDDVQEHKHIAFTMTDGRKVKIDFEEKDGATQITEAFDPESENSEEMQREGWQAIMNNFKTYAEKQ